MSEPAFFATPGYGDTQLNALHYHQAVRVGNRVDTSGQGGWNDAFEFPDDLEAEIVRAFDNVERTLETAGATWADVIAVDSYHVLRSDGFEAHNRIMVEQFRKADGRPLPHLDRNVDPGTGQPRHAGGDQSHRPRQPRRLNCNDGQRHRRPPNRRQVVGDR
uniref:Rid family hydrolase n=1 Tax=Paractinoplanes polyasparticus TaxID=2856853 RepID=UPI002103085F|nr:Rid family hydrolase [Actinoplanes polyasparticus]